MIAIHPIQRELAKVMYMCTDKHGNTVVGNAELKLLLKLLKKNLEFVRRTDELNNLSFISYQMGDTDWQHSICKQIDELEAEMK